MNRKLILAWVITILAVTVTAVISIIYITDSFAKYVSSYQDMVYNTERAFIENIPVYRDFATPSLEAELQKFDLTRHAAKVSRHLPKPLRNIDDINENIRSGKLVPLETGRERLYYFHNVRKEYRYLTPHGLKGLETISSRFQNKLQSHRERLPVVKLAVSSVIRTVNYQEKIFGRKFVSTHSYGGCIDIFFDDYFVALPVPDNTGRLFEKVRLGLHTRTGFLMGDALREQFRSVLTETLLELQREGIIYALLEPDRRCYHITILPD